MLSFIETLLQAAAWPIQALEPYSASHILLCVAGIPLAVLLARCLARICLYPRDVLPICDLILVVSKLYKQSSLYSIVSQGQYNRWYPPFQLYSIPTYLYLILPLFRHPSHHSTEKHMCIFIQDFVFLGGVMALVEPSGLMHPYLLLMLHRFLWHFMPIFIGLCCAMTDPGGRILGGFVSILPLFLTCVCIATFINVISHPYGDTDVSHISPYCPNRQIVLHRIILTVGTGTGSLLYPVATALGGFIYHLSLRRLFPR